MTLKSSTRTISYISTGVAQTFSWPFFAFLSTDLTVTVTNLTGIITTLALSTDGISKDYTVTGLLQKAGGSITLLNNQQAWLTGGILTAGYTLTISRVVPLTQLANVRGELNYNPEIHENEFDSLCMADQQLNDGLTLVQAVANPLGYVTLPVLTFAPALPTAGAQIYLTNNAQGKATVYLQFTTGTPIILGAQA